MRFGVRRSPSAVIMRVYFCLKYAKTNMKCYTLNMDDMNLAKEDVLDLSSTEFELLVESGGIGRPTILRLWWEEDGRDYINSVLADGISDVAASKIVSCLLALIDSEHKELQYEDAVARAEAALTLTKTAGRDLSGREDDIYWALALVPMDYESGFGILNGEYTPKIVGFVRDGHIAPPSMPMIEALVDDKRRAYKSDRTCLFLRLAFGTDPSEPKRLGEILLSHPNIMNFYGISDIIEDGITTANDLLDEDGDRLKQRMALLDDDALNFLEKSFNRFYTTKWEPDLIEHLFSDLRKKQANTSL